jgi:NAD(P)-dependent dehydrogenase (short-subunit alcohol dehydrogenase family)
MLLEGRVAVVSGIGPGMGRDISLTLASAGAAVVLAARREEKLREVAREVEALGRRAVCVTTDITDKEQCARLVAAAHDELGRVDVLVNNAFAEEDWATFKGFDLERWRAPFAVNVFGSLQLSQAVVPLMKAQGGGSIVMINTLSTRVVNPVLGGYASSKGALLVAAQVMAKELGAYGIRVNSIAPGHIWGESLKHYFEHLARQRGVTSQDVYDDIASQTALHHIPTSEEISRAVLFFASDLSRVITGQTLDVNAGRVFH